MCYSLSKTYFACGNSNQIEYILCRSPHCREVTSIRDNTAVLDFCPECFLTEDFGQLMQRPWTRAIHHIMVAHHSNLPSFGDRAREIYTRAADSQNTSLGENNILALVTEPSQLDSLRLSIVDHVFHTLIYDFWYRVRNLEAPPPLGERLLIVKLHVIIVSAIRQ